MATVMTETTTAKVREEQVTGLTAENAHRVTMIRERVRTILPYRSISERSIMERATMYTCTEIRKIGMNCIPGTSKTGKP